MEAFAIWLFLGWSSSGFGEKLILPAEVEGFAVTKKYGAAGLSRGLAAAAAGVISEVEGFQKAAELEIGETD